jgi:GT2 family glycosyltransferase
MFIGANLWIRYDWFVKVLGFDVGFVGGGQCEDLDLGWRTLDEGGKVAFNDGCRVYHPGPPGSEPSDANIERLAARHPDRWKRLLSEETSWQ